MVSGSVTVPVVSTGYDVGLIEVNVALALSLPAYRSTGDEACPLLGCWSVCGP